MYLTKFQLTSVQVNINAITDLTDMYFIFFILAIIFFRVLGNDKIQQLPTLKKCVLLQVNKLKRKIYGV